MYNYDAPFSEWIVSARHPKQKGDNKNHTWVVQIIYIHGDLKIIFGDNHIMMASEVIDICDGALYETIMKNKEIYQEVKNIINSEINKKNANLQGEKNE